MAVDGNTDMSKTISLLISTLLVTAACQPQPTVETNGHKPSPTPAVRHVAPRPLPPLPIQAPTPRHTGLSLQEERWRTARIRPQFAISVDKAVMLYLRTKGRYEAVERMHAQGVPAPVLFGLLMRECDNSFKCHPHNGDSLLARTHNVPRGRLPNSNPPYTFEASAADAYYVCDKLFGPWDTVTYATNTCIRFNGVGYTRLGINSPYWYSGTQWYERGKFTSDGHYSASAVDQQIGILPLLKRMQERGIKLRFDP